MTRDFSVYPIWFVDAPAGEYAHLRADEGTLGLGRCVSVRRAGESTWRAARVTEAPPGRYGDGFRVWLEWYGGPA